MRRGVEDVDQPLLEQVSAEQYEAMRLVLATLAEIKVAGLAAVPAAAARSASSRAPGPTEYGLREGSHTDRDGNLIRFGSPADDE